MDSREHEDQYIESWGTMGVLWGINRSMARIHAFLVLCGEPVDLDRISERLNISRGNTSMSLKELRSWGVIEKVNLPGERRDHYRVEPDTWRMFHRIAVERKRREFDPALHSLRSLLAESGDEQPDKVRERLTQMEELLSTFDRLGSRLLASEDRGQSMLRLFSNLLPK